MNKIRVLFVHGKLVCGGAEQALFDLTSLMDKDRFDITILALIEGGEWEERFRSAGVRVESIWTCQKESWKPWIKLENWKKRKNIVKALKNNNVGMIEACFDKSFDIIVLYNSWSKFETGFSGKSKTVMYVHSDIDTNSDYRRSILKSIDIIRKFDRIICVSDKAKDAFQRITGISEKAVAYINPLNSERIRLLAEEKYELSNSGKTICAVGRLSYEKGFERLIRIHKKLFDEGFRHKLVIVGEGPLRDLLEYVIHSIHCEDSVELVGYQANPFPYIKNSDFIVCPSYSEGLSMIAMEALILGVPVVSAVPTIKELFGDEVCGLITENDDANLEAGIRRMLQDHSFYEKAKIGAQIRSTFFEGKRMVQEIEEEFTRLVET